VVWRGILIEDELAITEYFYWEHVGALDYDSSRCSIFVKGKIGISLKKPWTPTRGPIGGQKLFDAIEQLGTGIKLQKKYPRPLTPEN